tara:strand:+ start:2951 stop:3283 length:333 start_codon:yes stop_codon:yes gene_type:complete
MIRQLTIVKPNIKNTSKNDVLSKKNKLSNQRIITKSQCKNCHLYYDPKNNDKCYYHPGQPIKTGLRINAHYDQYKYDCCNGIQIGMHPIVKRPKGCCIKNLHEPLSPLSN